MKQSSWKRSLVGIIIALLFVFIAFKDISFSSLIRDALKANFGILLLTTAVVLSSHVIRALRWRVILRELKKEISLIDTWGSVMVGYLANNFVPRLGELVRAYSTGRLESISVSGVFGTIVLERLFDMLSAGILFGLALSTYSGHITQTFPFLKFAGFILIAGSVAAGATLYIATTFPKARGWLMTAVKFLLPKRFHDRAEDTVGSFLTLFLLLRSPRCMLEISIYTAFVWIAYVFTLYIPFFAFGATSGLTLYDAFILILITSIAWMIPTPGAVGVYHLFVSQSLIKLFGVSPDQALAYATLTHLFGYVAITVVGSIFLFAFAQKLKVRSIRRLWQGSEEIEKPH